MSTLTLAVAKTHLNVTGSAQDGEIQDTIDEAEAAIAERVGPLVSTATTVRVRGMSDALVLPVTPALALTSVTPVDGTALTLADLYLDAAAGVVTYDSGGSFSARAYDVVYNAGRSSCPDDLLRAIKEMVRHLWITQRGPTGRPGSGASEGVSNTIPGAAYVFPFRVEQLLAPHEQTGFA